MKIDDFDLREQIEEYDSLFYQSMNSALLNELFSNSENNNIE